MSTATKFSRIYEGYFRDRNPDERAAGILINPGERVDPCIQPDNHVPRPTSPAAVKKFRLTLRPAPSERRVFYGVADDYDRTRTFEALRHGVSTKSSQAAGAVVNPAPLSKFSNHQRQRDESVYDSVRRAPLGSSHDQGPGLPEGVNLLSTTFGVKSLKDIGAKALVNPELDPTEIDANHVSGHRLYVKSHNSYFVGEQKHRVYDVNFDSQEIRGKPTPHDNAGRNIKRSMIWLTETAARRAAPLVSKRVDDYRERSQHQISSVHDPLKLTIEHLPKDHTFGILIKPDPYGAGDVIHGRVQSNQTKESKTMRGKDRARGSVAIVQHQMKKINYQQYRTLWQAFNDYDRNKNGFIEKSELAEACSRAGFTLEEELLNELVKQCGGDTNGKISFLAFVNYLNWKDYLPSGKPGQELEKLPNIPKSIDKAIGNYKTSAMKIKSVIGGSEKNDTREWRRYGIPTIRCDKAAPRLRRISDTTNYGDQTNAYGIVHPSIYAQKGVFEKDFFQSRSKEEIKKIFSPVININEESFHKIWENAEKISGQGKVNVETFRYALDQKAQELLNQ